MNGNKIIDDIKNDVFWLRIFGYFFLSIGVGFILIAVNYYLKEKPDYMIFCCIIAAFIIMVSIAFVTIAHGRNKMVKKILESLK